MAKRKYNEYQDVVDRDNGICQVCGTTFAPEIHHIIYRSHGGPDEAWNLITLCKPHHQEAHRSPERFPRWMFHGAIQHGMTVLGYAQNIHVVSRLAWRYKEALATCISCRYRDETNECEVWEQKVDWDYGCNVWEPRS